MVGSSIVKNAFFASTHRPGGANLGLQRLNVSIWWQGKGGMGIHQLLHHLEIMLNYEDPPTYLILHLAGNDIGSMKVGYLRNVIKKCLNGLRQILPNTTIVWSQILHRLSWRYSENLEAMQRSRYRINNSIAAFVLKNGGCYIRHPDILPNHIFLKEDGVHLTNLGNDIFLNNLQGGLELFLKFKYARVFP